MHDSDFTTAVEGNLYIVSVIYMFRFTARVYICLYMFVYVCICLL